MTLSRQRLEDDRTFSRRSQKLSPAIQDELWKSMQKHEKQLEQLWKWKWDFLISPHQDQDQQRLPSSSSSPLPTRDEQGKSSERARETASANGVQKHIHKQPCAVGHITVLTPSKKYPRTSAEVVGWRSSELGNSLEMFSTTPNCPPKIRLVQETYGYYRSKKLAQQEDNNIKTYIPPRQPKHFVKPILS